MREGEMGSWGEKILYALRARRLSLFTFLTCHLSLLPIAHYPLPITH
jgi:hypothetical protein